MRQLHSATYKNPTQLQQGATLVFGASHSGYDIAYELGGHCSTVLAGPDRGNLPLGVADLQGGHSGGCLPVGFHHVSD